MKKIKKRNVKSFVLFMLLVLADSIVKNDFAPNTNERLIGKILVYLGLLLYIINETYIKIKNLKDEM